MCYSPVCARFGIFCLENPFMSRSFSSVTAIVFPHEMAGIRMFLFTCVIQYSVIPYGYMYVGSLYNSLSGGLLHLCHKHHCAVRRIAWALVGGRSRAFLLVVARGSRGVVFSGKCKYRYPLFGKSIHVTIFHFSNRHSSSLLYG